MLALKTEACLNIIPMTPAEALSHFKTQAEIARVMAVTDAAVHLWVKNGRIPFDKQCQMQVATGGALIARREDAERVA